MARFVNIQTNFTTGELDPLVRSRIDLDAYNNALEKAENVICQPQGGVKRRPGLRYIAELGGSPGNGVRLVHFEFSVNDSYMLAFTNQRMYVFKDKALITDINGSGNDYLDVSDITSARIPTMCWTQSADTLIVVHEDMNPVKIVRGASDSSWTYSAIAFDSVPQYRFTETVDNPTMTVSVSGVSGKVTITRVSGTDTFNTSHVGQYFVAEPQGRAKIIERVSSTQINVVTEFPFFGTSNLTSDKWYIETGYEDVWSASKGYPRTVTFHQGRLFFGGSKARPSTIWGSKVAIFFDFEAIEGLDDDAVEATLDTNTFNSITDMISGRDLQVFTSGGEFVVPQEGLTPITPTDFFLQSVSRNGIKEGVRVQQLESGVLFIQRQGKQLSEIAYSDTQLTYVTSKISLLSGHLLKGPKSMDIRRAVNTDENDLLLIVNDDDGSIAAFSLLRAQNVIAPSEFTTNGDFIDVGVDITDIYTVVKRSDNGTDKYYVEVFDDNVRTDSAVTGTNDVSLDASHLDGQTVHVISDGLVEEDQTADSAVTFVNPPTTSCEVGMHFDVEVRTMPIDVRMQSGTRIGFKKRIVEVNALLYETQNLVINGNLVPIRTLGAGALDSAVPEFTGTKVLHGILGYSNDGKITVTQNAPLKFTLLGLEYKVATHQGT